MSSAPDALAVVMAGGVGSRLHPLTRDRAKPAVPFAGQYRIIDFTLTNCLHSGLRQILVLTQYKSDSLQNHLRDGWSVFNPSLGEYVTCVPPQMRTGDSWYAGTADALYQNRYMIQRSGKKNVVVLSGDHVYRMNYVDMVTAHEERNADLTIGCMEVPIAQASEFGVLALDSNNRVCEFAEKPSDPKPIPGSPNHALVSMGIYVFSTKLLCDELLVDHRQTESSHDFGKDLIPRMIQSHRVFGCKLRDPCIDRAKPYWRDVGTVDAFHQANMDTLGNQPRFNLHCRHWPIRTFQRPTPPSRIAHDSNGIAGVASDSVISSGVSIEGGNVKNCVLGPNVRICSRAIVRTAILMDNVEIGHGAEVRNCIIDKNVKVPDGELIGVNTFADAKRFHVSDNGIVVIPRDYQFQDPPKRDSGEPAGYLTQGFVATTA